MQAIFPSAIYRWDMTNALSRLKALREAAGISQRELARLIGEGQSNIQYWETTGKVPRSDLLIPLSKALGVTLEELLGEPRPKRLASPGGRARQLFDAVSKLPRRQQDKVLDILEPFVREQFSSGQAA